MTQGHWPSISDHSCKVATLPVRAEMFYGWIEELVHLSQVVRRNHQRVVRNLLLYYARDHAGTFIPDVRTFPKSAPAEPPRLVSDIEMARLIEVILDDTKLLEARSAAERANLASEFYSSPVATEPEPETAPALAHTRRTSGVETMRVMMRSAIS